MNLISKDAQTSEDGFKCMCIFQFPVNNSMRIRFAKPFFKPEWRQRILHLIDDSLDTGYLTNNLNVRAVEK